ncbi:MAG: methyltransferase [Planctomycetota bacterium]|nr:methyltransferase [Planctomycetota bacterium]
MATDSPRMIAGVRIPVRNAEPVETWFSRLWLAMPEWWGQAAGALAMSAWLATEIPAWFGNFWTMGAWYEFADGARINLPWTRVLVDLNILLVGLAFVFRQPARIRSGQAGEVLLSLLAGWWPLLPFLLVTVVAWIDPFAAAEWKVFIQRPQMNFMQVFSGASLIILGNALDLSGYATLFRSFSVLPEARELKTTGLYRFVRHPVYLGQFISQAGVWLIFAPAHWVWWSFYVTFIVLQLWRTKREDAVLERAFGNDFREWKERTFWFV